MEKETIKALIKSSTSFERADEILSKYTEYQTDEARIKYLNEEFGYSIVGRAGGDDKHTDYVALLTAIVNEKWRR